jgi:hypothetical protein
MLYRRKRREITHCKMPILYLASSEILTLHPPRRPASVYPPPLVRREDTLAGWRGGWGVNILEDARHSSVFYIYLTCKLSCCFLERTNMASWELRKKGRYSIGYRRKMLTFPCYSFNDPGVLKTSKCILNPKKLIRKLG